MSEFGRVDAVTLERRSNEYTVRPYRDGDRDGLLSLYRDVLSVEMTDRWFEWKYEDNPYADGVTAFVAETDGRIVGAAGFWFLELCADGERLRVVQSCDGAVREAHRRRGLYTRLFEAGLEYAADAGLEFVFDFPNELTRATFEKHGWRPVETRETHYRVHRPTAVVGDRLNGLGASQLDRGTKLLARGYLGARARARDSPADPDIRVERTDRVPPETLESVYRRDVPDRFHLVRDATFYRWRFRNPHWEYATFVGRRDGTPVAAIVTGTRTIDGATVTRLTDVVPLARDRDDRQTAAFAAVLERVLAANSDADLVAAPSSVTPTSVLRRYGFHSNLRLPLSLVTTPTVHGVYSLSADRDERDPWRVAGRRIADPDAWAITFAEYDTG